MIIKTTRSETMPKTIRYLKKEIFVFLSLCIGNVLTGEACALLTYAHYPLHHLAFSLLIFAIYHTVNMMFTYCVCLCFIRFNSNYLL